MRLTLKTIQTKPSLDLSELRKFVLNHVLLNAQERDKNSTFAWDIYEKLHSMGILHAPLPKALGGAGMPVSDLIYIMKELAYGSGGVATTVMANLLGYSPVVLYGSVDLQRKIFLNQQQNGLELWSFAMTESVVGFDVGRTQTVAKQVKGGYLIEGRKDYITNSSHAKHFSVFADVKNAEGKSLGIACFYVPGSTPGITFDKPMNKLGHKESNTCAIMFDKVFVPDTYLLGKIGEGLKILHHCLGRTKTLISAIASGICQRASDLAVEHLKSRIGHDGKSLLDKPAVYQQLARFHTEMEAAWLLSCMAAQTWDSGGLAIKESSMAKMYASDLAMRFTAEALELSGARGYSEDYEIARLFRDAKLLEIYEGSTQILEILIAKEIFKDQKREQKQKPLSAA